MLKKGGRERRFNLTLSGKKKYIERDRERERGKKGKYIEKKREEYI